jgi:hypothetical protein
MKKYILAAVFLYPAALAPADNAIAPFSESWALNISGKYVITNFSQEQSGQYTANRPWAVGLGIRYKTVSASLSLPPFYAPDESPLESFDIQLSSYYDFVYYEAFFKRYQGFTERKEERKAVGRDIDLSVFSTGALMGWLLNGENHSLSAAYDLDCKQLSSNGSLILGFGVFYTSIFSDDKDLIHYGDRQRFLYFGPNFGYSYTFIFSNSVFLNINLVIGLDAGLNISASRWLFIPVIIPKLSFGRHYKTWSINVSAGRHYTPITWNADSVDRFFPSTITVTFSKRF